MNSVATKYRAPEWIILFVCIFLGARPLARNVRKPKVKMSVFQDKEIPESNVYQESLFRIVNGMVHSNEVPFVVSHDKHVRYIATFNSIQLMSFKRE